MYTLAEVNELLENSPFRLWWLYEDVTFNPPDEDAERIHILARRGDQ